MNKSFIFPSISSQIETTKRLVNNHVKYMKENVKSDSDIYSLIKESSNYQSYLSALFEGVQNVSQPLIDVLNRHRLSLLEEQSESPLGFVSIAPVIIADYYFTPSLKDCLYINTVNNPFVSIPRLVFKSKTYDLSGTLVEQTIPKIKSFIKPRTIQLELEPNKIHNLFNSVYGGVLVTADKFSINMRELKISSINLIETNSNEEISIPVIIKPDARNQFRYSDNYLNDVKIDLIGNIDKDKGIFVYNIILSNLNPNLNYVTKNVVLDVLFSANKSLSDTTPTITLTSSVDDINLDLENEFKFEILPELLQDYESLFNINLIESLVLAIKTQIQYNQDHFIFEELYRHINYFKSNDLYDRMDFQKYRDTLSWLSPANMTFIFQSILPRLVYLSRKIFNNSYFKPKYIITGQKIASLIESIQEIIPLFDEYNKGKVDIHKGLLYSQEKVEHEYEFIILSSPAVDDNYLFIVSDHHENDPVISDFIYKPFYVIQEITDSKYIVSIRTRNKIRLLRPEACAVMKISGLTHLISYNSNLTEMRKEF